SFDMRLKDKVALITGGSSGIGRETSLLFAAEGASVVVVDLNDESGAKVVKEIQAAGGKAVYAHADVSKAADCEHMVKVAEDTYGKLSILFNNAGIMHGEDDRGMRLGPDRGDQPDGRVSRLQIWHPGAATGGRRFDPQLGVVCGDFG